MKVPRLVANPAVTFGKLDVDPWRITAALAPMVVMFEPAGKFNVPVMIQMPPLRVVEEYCVTVPERVKVPLLTDTVPVLSSVPPSATEPAAVCVSVPVLCRV